MAKELPKKIKPKNRKEESGIQTTGQQDYSELIKTSLEEFSITQAMQMAAFFTGKGTEAKTLRQAQQKANAAQPSILGKSNSILQTLQDLQKNLNDNLNIEGKKLGATVKSIRDILSYGLFDGKDALLSNIATNLDLIKREGINSLLEKLSIYGKTNDKLFELNKEIRENNEKNIVEAKLKLIIEGIDTSTIDALIKFSDLNLDKLDQNSKSLITFFESLKVLENIKLGDSIENLAMLNPIIYGFIWNVKGIRILNKLINEKDINAFNNMMEKMRDIFISLNKMAEVTGQSDPKLILKSFATLGESLGLMMFSIPLLAIVNKAFDKENSINLEKTGEIFLDLNALFSVINDVININKGKELLKSFMQFNLINMALVGSLPSINKVNEHISKNNLQNLSKNLANIYFLVGNNLFNMINGMKPIDKGKEIYKSFKIFKKLNKQLIKIVENINEFDKGNFDEGKLRIIGTSLSNISIIFDIINKMKDLDGKSRQKIATIAGFFGVTQKKGGKKINDSLKEIFNAISKIEAPEASTLNGIANSIEDIKNIIDSLNSINDIAKNSEEILDNLDGYLKVLEESYNKIQERFDQILATGDTAEKVKSANEKIAGAMDSTNETIVKTSSNEKDIKKSVVAIEGITEFMIGAAFVMSIGALFVMFGGGKFIKAAIEFGLALAVFEGLVLMPALMFNSQKEDALKGIEGFNGFVVTCALTMAIGALIFDYAGGKFVKNALGFGITLSIFEMLVIAPVLAFSMVKSNVLESIEQFSKFVITCTIIMAIGALIMDYSGGKLVENALKFGLVLAEFEFLVVAPFLLFSLIKKNVFESVKNFATLIITTSIIMMVGALLAQNDNFIKGAMEFGKLLMKFEVMIIAPFILFNFLRKHIFDGLQAFSTTVIVCTTVLLVGALFMTLGGGKFVKNALLFTGILALFEALIIAPFLIFNTIKRGVFNGLKDFAVVVFVATTVLIVGSIFMTHGGGKYPEAAMEFAWLLFKFEVAVVAPMILFNLVKRDALNGAKDFGMFIALCSFSLIVGAFFIANYGTKPIQDFEGILSWFVVKMTVMAVLMSIFGGEGTKAAKDFGLFILLCSAALIIGGIFMTIQDGKYAQGAQDFAILLGIFVVAMGGVMVALAWAFKASGGQEKIIAQMAAMGIFILSATVSLGLGAKIIKKYGWEKPLAFAAMLVGFVGLMGVVFGILGLPPVSVLVGVGSGVALLMGVALLALSGSIMLINKIFEKDPEGTKTQKNIEALIGVLDGTKWTFVKLGALGILIAPGAAVAALVGASLLVLGGAFRVLDIIMAGEGASVKKNIEILNNILKDDLMATYTLLGILSVPIAAGSIVATAIGLSMMVVGGSFELINLLMGEHGADTMKNILYLDVVLGELGKTFTVMGALSPLILLGSAAGTLMSVCVTIMGGALLLVNRFVEPIKETILNNLGVINQSISKFGEISKSLIKIGGWLTLSLVFLPQLRLFTSGLSKSTIEIRLAVDAIKKTGDISKHTKLMTSNIQNFIDIIDNVKGIGLLSGKKSKIREIQSLVKPLGETLGSIAGSVQSIASLKIPIDWDAKGNPIKYRNISDHDFDLATKNINRLLVTTAMAFVITWNAGLKNIANDKNGGFWKTMYFATNVGKILSGITDSVIKIGQALMPDPTSWDAENGRFTKYQKIDFDKASSDLSIVVTKVLMATANAFINAYNGDQNHIGIKWLLWGDPKQSPFLQAVDGITKMTQTLSSIIDSVIKIGQAQIPVDWNKDGQPIKFEKINVDDTIQKVNNILNGSGTQDGILGVLLSAYEQASIRILSSKHLTNANITNRSKNLAIIIDTISKSADLIIKIASLSIPTKFDKDGKATEIVKLKSTDIDDAKTNMIKIMASILSIFDASDQSNELSKYLTKVVIDPTNINKNINAIEKIIPNISKQIKSLLDFNKQIENIKIQKSEDQIASINGLYDGVISLITTIYGKLHDKTILESKNIGALSIDMGNVTKAVSTVFNSMGSIYKEFYNNVNKYKNNIKDIIGQLGLSDEGLNASVKNLKTNLDALKSIYTQEFADIDFNDSTLDKLSVDLNEFMESAIEPFDLVRFIKATNLNMSIDNIYKTLSKQQDKSKEFNKNTNALKTYIKAINTVELNKLRPLTTLVQELNKLANKLGNLDQLTNTIANDLAEVLKDLVSSLTEAKTTIHDAHKLQADRNEQIQKAIGKVRALMDAPLNINVMPVNNSGGDLGTPSSTDDGSDKSGGTPGGGTTNTGEQNKQNGTEKQPKSNTRGQSTSGRDVANKGG